METKHEMGAKDDCLTKPFLCQFPMMEVKWYEKVAYA